MSLKSKVKNQVSKKIKKIVFRVIKPFLPFILIIVGIVFAICTVIDALFTTEEDIEMSNKLYSDNYEEQYAEWLQEKENSPNTIIDGKQFVPTRYVYLADTWIYNYNFRIWYESKSDRRHI